MRGLPSELVAEHYGLTEMITEDLQDDRLYGTVRVVNPFLDLP